MNLTIHVAKLGRVCHPKVKINYNILEYSTYRSIHFEQLSELSVNVHGPLFLSNIFYILPMNKYNMMLARV